MRPFFPSLSNNGRAQGANNRPPQQGMLLNRPQFPYTGQNPSNFNTSARGPTLPNRPNHQFSVPPMPDFNNQNTHLSNSLANNPGNRGNSMPPPCFPNAPLNNHLWISPQQANFCLQNQAAQFGNVQQLLGQNTLQTLVQAQNLVAALMQQSGLLMPQNFQHNVNQTASLANGQMCLQNQMLLGNHTVAPNPYNLGLLGNSPMNLMNSNSNLHTGALSMEALQCKNQNSSSFAAPNNIGQSAMEESPATTQRSQPSASPVSGQTHPNQNSMQRTGHRWPQAHHAKDGRNGIFNVDSKSPMKNNSSRKFHGSGEKGSPQMRHRFQKHQNHDAKNANGSMKTFPRHGEPGRHQNWRERKLQPTNFSKEAPTERKRTSTISYTEKEIQQWRDARKKNFPTRANAEKKLAEPGRSTADVDGGAKLRRQQLKEILAKQKELGVEVAEIPPDYFSEAESFGVQNKKRNWENKRKERGANGKFQKNCGKRGRNGREKWQAKKQKVENQKSMNPIQNKREPTLLKKLLSNEIKRDKSRLLQVFRFMVLNSFFEHWPEQPLQFPKVTIKDANCENENETTGEKNSCPEEVGIPPKNGRSMVDEDLGRDEPSIADVLDGDSIEDASGDEMVGGHVCNREEGEVTE